jgi:hypothetical protein
MSWHSDPAASIPQKTMNPTTIPALRFTCSICAEPSGDICCWCTKDACENHLCTRCGRCSDCCHCEVPLDESPPEPDSD